MSTTRFLDQVYCLVEGACYLVFFSKNNKNNIIPKKSVEKCDTF